MERMPSTPYVICLGNAERAELESLSRRATAPHRTVLRARIVLLADGGSGNCEIGRRLGVCADTARKWRRRYCEKGLQGLSEAPRFCTCLNTRPCDLPLGGVVTGLRGLAALRARGWAGNPSHPHRLNVSVGGLVASVAAVGAILLAGRVP
jgi:Homeodomain-like domain